MDQAVAGSVRRTQLQSIIAQMAEGMMMVELDGTIGWANEAALAMHGVTDHGTLGTDLDDYATRFVLTYRNNVPLKPADYPAARALAGESLHDVVVRVARSGEEPEWMHKVRTIRLDEEGTAAGFIAIVMVDATEEYNAEARFEKTFGANPAPAIICRLDDLRYVKVNEGFLQMTGHHREDLMGASINDIDVLQNAERREEAMQKLREGLTIPQIEARIDLPAGGTKAVIVAGQPIEVSDQACMLFTFIDLERRRKAEVALARSEECFSKAFQLAPVPMLLTALKDAKILHANDAFVNEFGHGRAAAIGRSKAELELWADAGSQRTIEKLVREHGRAQSVPVALRSRTGRRVHCLLSADTVSILGEDCVLIVMLNVDERRRSETEVLAAVEAALQDTSWLGRKIVEKLNQAAGSSGPCPADALSDREREVLILIAQGFSDLEIAAQLQIARNTVRNHVRSIYATINVHHRSEAVVWARRRGYGELTIAKPISPPASVK